jgi:hypothetical protein
MFCAEIKFQKKLILIEKKNENHKLNFHKKKKKLEKI